MSSMEGGSFRNFQIVALHQAITPIVMKEKSDLNVFSIRLAFLVSFLPNKMAISSSQVVNIK